VPKLPRLGVAFVFSFFDRGTLTGSLSTFRLKLLILLMLHCPLWNVSAEVPGMMDLTIPRGNPIYQSMSWLKAQGWSSTNAAVGMIGQNLLSRGEAAGVLKDWLLKIRRDQSSLNHETRRRLFFLIEEFEWELEHLGFPRERIENTFPFMALEWDRQEKWWSFYNESSITRRSAIAHTDLQNLTNLNLQGRNLVLDLTLEGRNETLADEKDRSINWGGEIPGEIIERRLEWTSQELNGEPFHMTLGDLNQGAFGTGMPYGGNPVDGISMKRELSQGPGFEAFWGKADSEVTSSLTGLRFSHQHKERQLFVSAVEKREENLSRELVGSLGALLPIKRGDFLGEMSLARGGGLGLLLQFIGKSELFERWELGSRSYRDMERDISSPTAHWGKASTQFDQHQSLFLALERPMAGFNHLRFSMDTFRDDQQSGLHLALDAERPLKKGLSLRMESRWDNQPESHFFQSVEVISNRPDHPSWNLWVANQTDNSINEWMAESGISDTFFENRLNAYFNTRGEDLLEDWQLSLNLGVSMDLVESQLVGLQFNMLRDQISTSHEGKMNWVVKL
jgi:hypothetical protein